MKMNVFVADEARREELFAEAWIDDVQWCELSQEGGKLLLTLLPRRDSSPLEIEFDVVLKLFQFMSDFLKDGADEKDAPAFLSWDWKE